MVGGNLTAVIANKRLVKTDTGESVFGDLYIDFFVSGWLDFVSGSSSQQAHKTKHEESTHIWICDFDERLRELDIAQYLFICRDRLYEIKQIDDPMELHDHLEILLKLVGKI